MSRVLSDCSMVSDHLTDILQSSRCAQCNTKCNWIKICQRPNPRKGKCKSVIDKKHKIKSGPEVLLNLKNVAFLLMLLYTS